ncbi:MAG TPA: 3-methyl-2-oxobutanoate hydroxymethyltransferase [Gaiellales bacterium]|jgi:3-methyl-2-oxobutanoate hydroxymethyltransferase|nr:3-methyl-2-oxobutanoate hydroxymethyltransferase [Gaiellales bacterium]
MKISLPQLHDMKLAGTPIVMVTAYDHPSGRIVDQAGVDMVLVGDSAANTVLGHDAVSTVGATMDELLVLTRAVARACTRPLVIGDLPFMSYQVSDEDAVRNGGRFIKEAGADAVKLEGGGQSVQRAAALTAAGIPVVGHIGLTPQTATFLGGHKAQGRQWQQAKALYDSAVALQAAGCFAIVLECVPEPVAAAITRRLTIPTIGIGSGAACDGQVLVLHDLLDIRPDADFLPKFVKQFAHVGAAMREGVTAYANEVRSRSYPAPEHTYAIDPDQLSAFEIAVEAGAGGDNVLADW